MENPMSTKSNEYEKSREEKTQWVRKPDEYEKSDVGTEREFKSGKPDEYE